MCPVLCTGMRGKAADVDDRPRPAGAQVRQAGGDAIERAVEGNGENLAPIGQGHAIDRRLAPHRRVVHQDIEAAETGDGSLHQAYNFTLLKYAGNNQWSYEEDIYNPAHFKDMIRGWLEKKKSLEGKQA